MIKFGCDTNIQDLKNNTAIHYAALDGNLEICKILVEGGSSVEQKNKNSLLPLHMAVFSDDVPTFKYLLEQTEIARVAKRYKNIEKTIDVRTFRQMTPLMLALEENKKKIFKYILEQGGSLTSQDEDGHDILQRSILLKNQNLAKELIQAGANIESRSFSGETPLMLAVRHGLLDVTRALVNQGADIFEKNSRGDNLLHLAAVSDQMDVIGFVYDKGLSIHEKNKEGKRPRDCAKRKVVKDMLSNEN